jgi:Family of unknown function (DUF6491)
MRAAILIAACAALGACATATKEVEVPVTYTVVAADASIPFASKSIRNFRVGSEKTLLLEAAGGKWYRATLISSCRNDLPWEEAIGIDAGTIDRFDRFSAVVIDGRRCHVQALDQIEDPDGKPAPPPA